MSYQAITGLTLAAMALLAWCLVCLVGHGYANTIDCIALWLHRHATDSRKRHARRQISVSHAWAKQRKLDRVKVTVIDKLPDEIPEPEPEPEPEQEAPGASETLQLA